MHAHHRSAHGAQLVRDEGAISTADHVVTSIRQYHELHQKVGRVCCGVLQASVRSRVNQQDLTLSM